MTKILSRPDPVHIQTNLTTAAQKNSQQSLKAIEQRQFNFHGRKQYFPLIQRPGGGDDTFSFYKKVWASYSDLSIFVVGCIWQWICQVSSWLFISP